MISKIKIYAIGFCSILFLNSCSDFEELNSNPDAATKVTAPMLATRLILNITESDISSTKGFLQPFMLSKSIVYTEFDENYQYNFLGRGSLDGLTILTNVEKMIEASPEGDIKNSYTALGKFMRAYKFYNSTIRMGDIPYSDALKGQQGIIAPKYDAQKAVFQGILKELEEAEALFAQGAKFDGDPIYNGDVNKWRKMVNSFELQVLMSLSKKVNETDLRIKERFNEIVSTKPIFTSNSDNFQLIYSDVAGQRYPWYKLGNSFIIYPVSSSVLLDELKGLNDNRLFYYANPSPVQVAAGKSPSDFESYIGVDPAMVYSDITRIFATNDFSPINSRYSELPNAEPVYILSYSMIKFILAEAAVRGWISEGTAETHYLDGIKAAMQFTASNTPDNAMFHHNNKITEEYISKYLVSDKVKLIGNQEDKIKQIITQRFISTFLQAPFDAFFENRRTGYPTFRINPQSNANLPSDKLPVRWMYPNNELSYNTENVNAAISSQFGGNDDHNQLMWMLK
jgi:hypothetical protein